MAAGGWRAQRDHFLGEAKKIQFGSWQLAIAGWGWRLAVQNGRSGVSGQKHDVDTFLNLYQFFCEVYYLGVSGPK